MTKTHFIEPTKGVDATPAVRAALADPTCQRIAFRPGRYDFHPDSAAEQYLFISNNDEGLKRVAFLLKDRNGFEIDGGGATFVFHGGIIPFAALNCRNLLIHQLSVDWAIPFHGEAEVVTSDADGVILRVRPGFSCRVAHGRIAFGDPAIPFTLQNCLEFDPRRRETAFQVRDNYGIGDRATAHDLGDGLIRLAAKFSEPRPTPGNVIALMGERRDFPAITAQGCSDLNLRHVTIHHAGGMGVIAQRCTNVTVDNLRVTPPDPGSRIISTTADATHFVNCRGTVRLIDCTFENQMDDATNVHGIYTRIEGVPAPGQLDLQLVHRQQLGVEFAAPGDQIEIVDRESLATTHTGTVTHVQILNKERLQITIDPPPPTPPRPGDAVANLTWSADVEILRCSCRGNRARGFLVSTGGRIIVEENTLHTPGAGVLIEGDANHWFESGAVRDVLIRRNLFDNCNYGIWGRAAIQLSAGIPEPLRATTSYHRNVRIEDNHFIAFDRRVVYAHATDGMTIKGNRITPSTAYPALHAESPPFEVSACRNVSIANNALAPSDEPAATTEPAPVPA